MQKVLNIDERFKELIPPLATGEYLQLEESIVSHGCRDPIVIWNDTIIDGHNRYAICTKHGLGFETVSKSFSSRRDATLWILQNQLGRRNLSNAARIEIALNKAKLTSDKYIRKTAAEDAGVCEQTVQKYMHIKEIADPEILARLRNGEITIGETYRTVRVTLTENIGTPAENIRNFEKAAISSIASIKKLYGTIQSNYRMFAPDDAESIDKLLKAQREKLGRVMLLMQQKKN